MKCFNHSIDSPKLTHQWTYLVNIGYIINTFLILTNSSFYMNESLKGTNCIQKSFDGISILPDKVYLWAELCFVYSRYQGNLW